MAFSRATRIVGTQKIVVTRNIRLTAVYITATLAHFWDLPSGSPVVLSRTSIPVLISVCRMKYALRKPALATAKKELRALRKTSLLP